MEGKNGNSHLLVGPSRASNYSLDKMTKDQLNLAPSIRFRQLKKQYFKKVTRSMGVDSSYYLG